MIAPPAAIVFDIERGPFFYGRPWGMTEYEEKNAYTNRKSVYLKIGPLYLNLDEWDTYVLISRMARDGKYFASGRGLEPLLVPKNFGLILIDYRKEYYDTLYPEVRKVFDNMKFVRIFSIQMFKDNPKIRAYAVMVPPGVIAAVRDFPSDEVPGYNFVKDTKAELDRISGKQPNIKETYVREKGRDPDGYGSWKYQSELSYFQSYAGGLFIVYPTKADGTEWTAELVDVSMHQNTRSGIGGVFPSTWIEEDGYDGQIYYDQTAPTHWKALMDGNPDLIIEDYKNALTRNHFVFSFTGFFEFHKNDKGEI